MIQITLKHKDSGVVSRASELLVNELRKQFGDRVAGPVVPAVSRIQNLYLRLIVLKIEAGASTARVREMLGIIIQYLLSFPEFKSVRVSPDVDPE